MISRLIPQVLARVVWIVPWPVWHLATSGVGLVTRLRCRVLTLARARLDPGSIPKHQSRGGDAGRAPARQ